MRAMRIASFWAKGYRSLRDVRIDGLGAFNIFYGPNGGGKTNILEGIQTLFLLARVRITAAILQSPLDALGAKEAVRLGVFNRRDLCARDPGRTVVLGALLVEDDAAVPLLASEPLRLRELTIEVTFDWIVEGEPKLSISALRAGDEDLLRLWYPDAVYSDQRAHLQALVSEVLPARAYGLVRADRQPRPETTVRQSEPADVIPLYLQSGLLKNALLAAQLSPSHEVRRKLAEYRTLLAGPPLHRPPFAPVQDPLTGEVDLREALPEPNPEGQDISIDLAGLGIAQIYSILAQAMLLRKRAVGIEEPEAHLHAPTSGRALRQLLVRLVEEKHIDQLFIATHSNLFDLDPMGYYDVSLQDGCTVVKRSDLTRIDREHLYEPGPAKHALARLLQYAPEDEVVFRRSDGSPVTAKEMLGLLQEDDDVAVKFLQDVHGAAVRMVKVQAKKPQGG